MKDAVAGIMAGLEPQVKFAQALAQAGQEGPAKMLMQAAQLTQEALGQLGAGGGAQPTQGVQSPEAAGTNAQPANMATR